MVGNKKQEFIEILQRISQNITDEPALKKVLDEIVKEEKEIFTDGDYVFSIPLKENDFLKVFSKYSNNELKDYLKMIQTGVYMCSSGNLIDFLDSKVEEYLY